MLSTYNVINKLRGIVEDAYCIEKALVEGESHYEHIAQKVVEWALNNFQDYDNMIAWLCDKGFDTDDLIYFNVPDSKELFEDNYL